MVLALHPLFQNRSLDSSLRYPAPVHSPGNSSSGSHAVLKPPTERLFLFAWYTLACAKHRRFTFSREWEGAGRPSPGGQQASPKMSKQGESASGQ